LIGKYGDDPRSSHYTNAESQEFRFAQLCRVGDINNKTVLDVGCGIGDLCVYLRSRFDRVDYTGIDINPDAIEFAKKKHRDASFHLCDLTSENRDRCEFPNQDYVMTSGVFNNSFLDSTEYLEELVKAAFNKSIIGLAFNFISDQAHKKDKGMAYHDPLRVLQFCMDTLSERTTMFHRYERADVSIFVYRE